MNSPIVSKESGKDRKNLLKNLRINNLQLRTESVDQPEIRNAWDSETAIPTDKNTDQKGTWAKGGKRAWVQWSAYTVSVVAYLVILFFFLFGTRPSNTSITCLPSKWFSLQYCHVDHRDTWTNAFMIANMPLIAIALIFVGLATVFRAKFDRIAYWLNLGMHVSLYVVVYIAAFSTPLQEHAKEFVILSHFLGFSIVLFLPIIHIVVKFYHVMALVVVNFGVLLGFICLNSATTGKLVYALGHAFFSTCTLIISYQSHSQAEITKVESIPAVPILETPQDRKEEQSPELKNILNIVYSDALDVQEKVLAIQRCLSKDAKTPVVLSAIRYSEMLSTMALADAENDVKDWANDTFALSPRIRKVSYGERQAMEEDLEHGMPPEVEKLYKESSKYLSEGCLSWDFSVSSLQKSPLVSTVAYIVNKFDLLTVFPIQKPTFYQYLMAIERDYHDANAYHNKVHAADVVHAVFYLCNQEKVRDVLEEKDLFYLLFASMVHDVDHPGYNNNFLISTKNELATLYNDKAVLEQHHVAHAFKILKKHDFLQAKDINTGEMKCVLSPNRYKEFRKFIIELVLATDFSMHFALIGDFKAKVIRMSDEDKEKHPEHQQEFKISLMKILIKCADVNHPTRKLHIHHYWTTRVLDEFFHQGDEEIRLNVPASPFMNRQTTSIPKSQLGFIDFLISPLYTVFDEFQPFEHGLDNLSKNRDYWQKRLTKSERRISLRAAMTATRITARFALSNQKKRVDYAMSNRRIAEEGEEEEEEENEKTDLSIASIKSKVTISDETEVFGSTAPK